MALGTTGTIATAVVAAGLAGAGAALLVGGPGSASPAAASGDARRVADLEERIAKQDKELHALRARLEELSAMRAEAPPSRGPGVIHQDGGQRTIIDPSTLDSDAPIAADAEDLSDLPPAERTRIERLFTELRAREQEEGRKARRQAQEIRMRGRLDRLPAALGLTPEAKDSVVKAYNDLADRRRAIFEEARAAGTPEAARAAQEKAQAAREETRQALALILTPDQMKAVEQVVDRGLPIAAGRFGAGAGSGGRRGGAREDAGSSGTPPR